MALWWKLTIYSRDLRKLNIYLINASTGLFGFFILMLISYLIEGNTIYGINGSAISLGDYTASTKIKSNSLTDIIPVDLLGTPFSVGIQAQFSVDLEIMYMMW